MKRNLKSRYFFFIIYCSLSLIPIIWLFLLSIRTNNTIMTNALEIPKEFHFENYITTWKSLTIGHHLLNTFLISILALIIGLIFTIFTSYLIARFNFPGKNAIYLFFLAGLTLPTYTAIYPLFIGLQALHMYNKMWSLSLIYAGFTVPISVLIMVGFMKNIPKELEEAAYMDGAGVFTIFFKIIVPLSKPAIFTVATLTFLTAYWNDFILAAVLISDPAKTNISVAIASTVTDKGVNYVTMAAAVMMSIVPEIIAFLIFQKYIISGLTMGAVKE